MAVVIPEAVGCLHDYKKTAGGEHLPRISQPREPFRNRHVLEGGEKDDEVEGTSAEDLPHPGSVHGMELCRHPIHPASVPRNDERGLIDINPDYLRPLLGERNG